jgi:hypothetical protein
MDISRMSNGIVQIINKKFKKFSLDDCIDIVQIKNICNLYNVKGKNSSVSLSEIEMDTPDFDILNKKKNISSNKPRKDHTDILKSEEFIKKYSFFIRTIYACLKVEVDMFDIKDEIATLKNNYQLLKSIKIRKKEIFEEHIKKLIFYQSNISCNIDEEYYQDYFHKFIAKIRILEKIIGYINQIINSNILEKSDSLLSLILPYFYVYTEFIEEYK